MADRKVKLDIDMSSGIASLKRELSSITDLSKRSMLNIQHAQERHNAKMAELSKDLRRMEANLQAEDVAGHRRAKEKIEQQERNHQLKMKQMMESAKLNSMQSRGISLKEISTIAHYGGFTGLSTGLRTASALGIGSEMGVAGIAAVAGGAAAPALGAVVVASKLVEVGFEAVSKTAQSFVGAISQIGKARNLQEMLVESSNSERSAANIRNNLTENLTTGQVLGMINSMSSKTEFSPDQIANMFNSYKAKTGDVSSLNALGTFGADFASVSGMSTEETGSLLGQLNTELGLKGKSLRNAALMLWQQGKAGSVELKDAGKISRLFGFAEAAGNGNLQQGIANEMGAAQLTQKGTGGMNAKSAITAVERLNAAFENSTKSAALQSIIGGGSIGTHDANGMFRFRDFNDTLARTTLAAMKNPGAIEKELGKEGVRVPRSIGAYIQEQDSFKSATTDVQKLGAIKDIIDKMSNSEVVIDEFDGALKNVKDTVDYQFKQTFNELSTQLEGALLPVLKELTPSIKELTKYITDHKDEIVKDIKELAKLFKDNVPSIEGAFSLLVIATKAVIVVLGLLSEALKPFLAVGMLLNRNQNPVSTPAAAAANSVPENPYAYGDKKFIGPPTEQELKDHPVAKALDNMNTQQIQSAKDLEKAIREKNLKAPQRAAH